jgi:hypothetical protein
MSEDLIARWKAEAGEDPRVFTSARVQARRVLALIEALEQAISEPMIPPPNTQWVADWLIRARRERAEAILAEADLK